MVKPFIRADGRRPDALRPVKVRRRYIKHAEGSVLIEVGETRVLCTATVQDRVPSFLRGQGRGWVTAEYAMLPRATSERTVREVTRGRMGGRTQEIQRLIGRSLRAVVDLTALGERTIVMDCDVLQADGGTRTVAITGAFIALADALVWARRQGWFSASGDRLPLRDYLAAVSVGKVNGTLLLDMAYAEDASAEVDLNLVMTGSGRLVEVQGTAERTPFTKADLDKILALGERGIRKLIGLERTLLGSLS